MRDLIDRGLSWLYEGADKSLQGILTHHGIFSAKGDLYLQIIPAGQKYNPVLILDAGLNKKFNAKEHKRLSQMVHSLGYPIEQTIKTDTRIHFVLHHLAHDRVMNFVENYYRGCPTHKNCDSPYFLGECDWFRKGNALVKYPDGWH